MSQKPQMSAAVAEAEREMDDAEFSVSMDKRVDLVISLIVAAAGAYICYLASKFRVGTFPDPVTARGLPYFTGGFMVFAGLANAARRVLTWSLIPGRLTVAEGADDEPGYPASVMRPVFFVCLAVAWCILLRELGYLIVTPIALIGMLALMNVRTLPKLIGFPVGFSLVVWFVFTQLLEVSLPMGPLAGIARAWGLAV